MRQNRSYGFFIIALTYIIAIFTGTIVFAVCPASGVYFKVLLADIAATAIVFLSGVVFKNASIYDPYWSVQPLVILTGMAISAQKFDTGIFMLLLAVLYWSIRLTGNWAVTFKNLDSQDWRYDNFKERFPHLFPLISFSGIHMFPTLVVYFAVLPGISFIQNSAVNQLTAAGFLICIFAATLQLFADRQMHRFRKARSDDGALIRTGLWKYSRHPNYLGEILMWWGVYIMLLSVSPGKWILGAGALINTLMFLFISIPMADRRNSKKPGYERYISETRNLLPLKRAYDNPAPY